MRAPWLFLAVALLAAGLAIGAVACDDDGEDGDGDQTPVVTLPAADTPADEEPAATEPEAAATEPGATGATVALSEHPDLGSILADASGNTLYTFDGDEAGVSNCTEGCAEIWPPFTLDSGDPTAGEGVTGELGVIQRADGSQQVTYDGRPLYHYSQDSAPGDANGQGVADVWFVVEVGG